MLPLMSELNSASFRGVPFLFDSHEVGGGRKIVTHEYPNKTQRFVEDLGGLLKVFRIRGTVTGVNYTNTKNALITALETPGIGTFNSSLFRNRASSS